MKSLNRIGKGKTDKYHHGFLIEYQKYFEHLRNDPITLLEIGVHKGGSLRMWAEYFPNAQIYGVDIPRKRNSEYVEDRITVKYVNQDQIYQWDKFFKEVGDIKFDIIIDDGSHFIEHQQRTFGYLFQKVKPGGFYVIEDLHTSLGETWGNMSFDVSTLNVLDRFERTEIFSSEFVPQKQTDFINENTEYCNVFRNRTTTKTSVNGWSITSIIKMKPNETKNLYLELMKKSLLGFIEQDDSLVRGGRKRVPFDEHSRTNGVDWPSKALSMIGLKRMNSLQECIEKVISENIEGDFIETGVWRGGACIFMQAVLKAYQQDNVRDVYVADSFEGLPKPILEDDLDLSNYDVLAVSLDEVKNNFRRYDLLDDNVKFIKGYFEDTMSSLKGKWSILRLDGDMYSSTKVVLDNLYQDLSIGGFVIIDDYNCFKQCKSAVNDFRKEHNITEKLIKINDRKSAYWRKER
jgi:hypothetical protein